MTDQNTLDYMKIHFTWIDWCLEHNLEVRKRITTALEEERVQIALEESLKNMFLLRRMKDVAFQNLIYYKILTDKNQFRNIIPKITEILSKNIMYEDEVVQAFSDGVPSANSTMPFDSLEEISRSHLHTNMNVIRYLHGLLQYYIQKEDIENMVNVKNYLTEYLTNTFNVNELFTSTFVYSGKSYPVAYERISKAFLVENLKNYSLYEVPNEDRSLHFRNQLSGLFAHPLKEKLRQLAFQILEVEETPGMILEYPTFFNHLLSVASVLYFNSLDLDTKLELLNSQFELDDLIELLSEYDYAWDFILWKITISYLHRTGFNVLALKIVKIILDKYLSNVDTEYKYFLYETKGCIHRDLEEYEKSLEAFKLALEWADQSLNYALERDYHTNEGYQNDPGTSPAYRKSVTLKNIGEAYGHLDKKEEMKSYFSQVENSLKDLEEKYEQYSLFFNLATANQRLGDYQTERDFLNKALDLEILQDHTIPVKNLEIIEQRIEEFGITEMSQQELRKLAIEDKVRQLFFNGKFLQKSFSFNLSTLLFKNALALAKELNLNYYIILSNMNLGVSYFHLKEWEQSLYYINEELSLRENFESELYSFIPLNLSGKTDVVITLLEKFYPIFKKDPNAMILIPNWVVNIMNNFTHDEFQDIIPRIEKLNEKIRHFYFFKWGNSLADNGFSKLAIELFEKELPLTPNPKIKATIYNDIGGVYSDMDDLDTALKYFKMAISLDKNYALCFANMAEIYSRKLDNVKAKQCIAKAIKIEKKSDSPFNLVEVYKAKLKEINLLSENILNINAIDSEEIRNILISAERKFMDYQHQSPEFDASDIILSYSKALEGMLHDKVSSSLSSLIDKFREDFMKRKTSYELAKKFGMLARGKTISLGTWVRIMDDFKNLQKDCDVEEFRLKIIDDLGQEDCNLIGEACSILVDTRNKIAHLNMMNIEDVKANRKELIPLMNKVIDLFY